MKTLNITSSRASIDITTTRAQLDIKNTVRRKLRIKTTRPQMEVQREAPKMKVNWKKVWADRGIRSPEYFRRYTVQNARQMVDQYVQKTVYNGNYLGSPEEYHDTGINPIGTLAYEETMSDIPEIQMADPLPSPEVEWTDGSMKIEWTPGDVEIVWEEDFAPQITVTPHSVEIHLRNRSDVKITVNEDNIPKQGGKKVDKKV